MRSCLPILALLAVLAGCQGPILTGGFNHSPYRSYGVDGPGPGVVSDAYQPMAMHTSGAPAGMPPMMSEGPCCPPDACAMPSCPLPPPPMMMGPMSQVNFIGLESLTINWDARVPGTYDSEPLVCPATHDFGQGNIYRLKLSNIPGRPGRELYPTIEIAPTMARTQAFLAHNSIPVEFTDNDFDQVISGNFITKVVYLPNPEYQGLAMAGVGTLVNTQLEPGVDPIVEASNRGAILAVIRMGNKDLSSSRKEMQQRQQQMQQQMMGPAVYGQQPHPGQGMMMPPQNGGFPVNGSTLPQNVISGVNIAPYGTPITKTTTGVPGPPQLPQGQHAPNRYPVIRTEPIPAPPRPMGVEPQNVVMYPHYTSQMQLQENCPVAPQ